VLAAVLAAAALNQEIEAFARSRIIRRRHPGRGGSGCEAERRDRGENLGSSVAETGAGGHDQYSFRLVRFVCFALAGSFPLPTQTI
jgi:hypothetical protein